MLVTTADTDDRVVPGHSFKYIAALQAAQAGDAPVLVRIETRAGHGSGKPTDKLIEEYADEWAFLVANLHMELPPGYGGNERDAQALGSAVPESSSMIARPCCARSVERLEITGVVGRRALAARP